MAWDPRWCQSHRLSCLGMLTHLFQVVVVCVNGLACDDESSMAQSLSLFRDASSLLFFQFRLFLVHSRQSSRRFTIGFLIGSTSGYSIFSSQAFGSVFRRFSWTIVNESFSSVHQFGQVSILLRSITSLLQSSSSLRVHSGGCDFPAIVGLSGIWQGLRLPPNPLARRFLQIVVCKYCVVVLSELELQCQKIN